MVDRVELDVVDQVAHPRVLDRDHPVGGEPVGDAGDEAVEVGDVGHDVVGDDHVGRAQLVAQLAGHLQAEEGTPRSHARLVGRSHLVGSGIDPHHGDAVLDEVAEQVAVVAGQLDHQAVGAEVPVADQPLGVGPRVGEERVGERREVGVVVGKQHVLGQGLGDLHHRAVRAERHLERVARVGRIQLVLPTETVRERGGAQIEEGVERRVPAGATPEIGAHAATHRRSVSIRSSASSSLTRAMRRYRLPSRSSRVSPTAW